MSSETIFGFSRSSKSIVANVCLNWGAPQLRHNYAVENINSWTDEGFGFDAKMLYLSKSMGHSVIESTKNYYSLVPRMADILEAHSDSDIVIPEVDYD